jgi:protein-tyrosine phosphatase
MDNSLENKEKFKVLLVCMGNICRSPTAEGVLRAMVDQAGLADRVLLDSAGTHGYHIGKAPDPRSQRAAARRGYMLNRLRARQVEPADFERFELVLAADRQNLRELKHLCPPALQHKLDLMLAPLGSADDEVPDPYYGQGDGFELVLDLLEEAGRAWIARWRAEQPDQSGEGREMG